MNNGLTWDLKRIKDGYGYFLDQAKKKVVAYVFGPRTDKTLKQLLQLVEHLPISHIFTDDCRLISDV